MHIMSEINSTALRVSVVTISPTMDDSICFCQFTDHKVDITIELGGIAIFENGTVLN